MKKLSGFTVIEALAAVLILGIVAYGTVGMFSSVDKTNKQSRLLSTQIALENQLKTVLEDPGNYPPGLRAALTNPSSPSSTTFNIDFMGKTIAKVNLTNPSSVFVEFQEDGSECAISRSCPIRIETRFVYDALSSSWTYAYRIKVDSKTAGKPMTDLGLVRNSDDNPILQTHPVPEEVYKPSTSSGTSSSILCSGDSPVLTNPNSTATSAQRCLKFSATNCGENQMPVGLEVEVDSNGAPNLNVKCQNLASLSSADSYYAIHSFNPADLLKQSTSSPPQATFAVIFKESVPPLSQNGNSYCPSYLNGPLWLLQNDGSCKLGSHELTKTLPLQIATPEPTPTTTTAPIAVSDEEIADLDLSLFEEDPADVEEDLGEGPAPIDSTGGTDE